MRGLSTIFLVGIFLSFGPAPSLGFLASPQKSIVTSTQTALPSKEPLLVIQRPQHAASSSVALGVGCVPTELLTSFLSPTMGFVKSEWTVSYGYGFATALGALSLLPPSPLALNVANFHALALVFYGLRLNSFLFLRNRLSPTYREIGKKIEEGASKKYPSRLSRAPFIFSCGLLYYGLVLPVKLTGALDASALALAGPLLKTLVGLQWTGYLVAALGDLTKSYVKASEKNGKFLVTSGIFSLLRHPNFTGEILSWTANALTGILAGGLLLRSGGGSNIVSLVGSMGLSAMGSLGMVFVLLSATRNLENRHATDHGGTEKYKKWISTSWSGWCMPPKAKPKEEDATHEITLDAETEEDFGSGI